MLGTTVPPTVLAMPRPESINDFALSASAAQLGLSSACPAPGLRSYPPGCTALKTHLIAASHGLDTRISLLVKDRPDSHKGYDLIWEISTCEKLVTQLKPISSRLGGSVIKYSEGGKGLWGPEGPELALQFK